MENQIVRVSKRVTRKHIVKRRQMYNQIKRTNTSLYQPILQENSNERIKDAQDINEQLSVTRRKNIHVVIQENLQPVDDFYLIDTNDEDCNTSVEDHHLVPEEDCSHDSATGKLAHWVKHFRTPQIHVDSLLQVLRQNT